MSKQNFLDKNQEYSLLATSLTSVISKDVAEALDMKEKLSKNNLKNKSYCFDESSETTEDQIIFLQEQVEKSSRFDALFEELRKQPRKFTVLTANMPIRESARQVFSVTSCIEPRYSNNILLSRNKEELQGKLYVQTIKNRDTKTTSERPESIYYIKKQDD